MAIGARLAPAVQTLWPWLLLDDGGMEATLELLCVYTASSSAGGCLRLGKGSGAWSPPRLPARLRLFFPRRVMRRLTEALVVCPHSPQTEQHCARLHKSGTLSPARHPLTMGTVLARGISLLRRSHGEAPRVTLGQRSIASFSLARCLEPPTERLVSDFLLQSQWLLVGQQPWTG